MGRCIVKFQDQGKDYYMEWTTICDAPATYGMSLEEFTQYYGEWYGKQGLAELPERLARIGDGEGTGFHGERDIQSILCVNRAGKNETKLTREQVIAMYCRREGDIVGESWGDIFAREEAERVK
jgi:hypothetical protein